MTFSPIKDEETSSTHRHLLQVVETPPGVHWDQASAARLKALSSIPLDASKLALRVLRLGPWRPDRPGRFAICAIRRERLLAEVSIAEVIAGRPYRFVFRAPDFWKARIRAHASDLSLGAAVVVVMTLAVAKGVVTRETRDIDLRRQESAAAVLAHRDKVEHAARVSSRLLKLADAEHGSFSDLAFDLAWLARAKSPNADLANVHWHAGILEVTSSADSPLTATDRPVEMEADDGTGLRLWRIGAGQPVIERAGFPRPSIVDTPQVRPPTARRP